jgi:hypothetical protein
MISINMQNIIVLIKQTSIQYPDKVWDTALHFSNTLEDRQLLKQNKKLSKEFKYSEKLSKVTGDHIPFLSPDKKSVYRLFLTTEELYQFDLTNWFVPHQEKGLISFEELAKLNLDQDTALVFNNLLSMYVRDKSNNNQTNIKFLSKFISLYGVDAIVRATRLMHNFENDERKNNDNNN